MLVRAAGILLFLPVPVVLLLFTRAPLGVVVSLAAGSLLTATHRLYARPFALSRAASRCLWCGASLPSPAPAASPLVIDEPFGRTTWQTCDERHGRSVRLVLGWSAERTTLLKLGILGTLAAFLVWGAVVGITQAGTVPFEDAVAFFRLGIAATVLPLGWLSTRAEPSRAEPLRAPFPLHVPALIGLCAVLWLFRLIGLLWLVQGALHFAQRAGLL